MPPSRRWLLLLVASSVFYMAFVPAYILVLALLILIDYVAALLIERAEGEARRIFLWSSICANVGLLAVFKYYGFLTTNVTAMATAIGHPVAFRALDIALPIGLSFHTFEAMSYTIEVYRGIYPAKRPLGS